MIKYLPADATAALLVAALAIQLGTAQPASPSGEATPEPVPPASGLDPGFIAEFEDRSNDTAFVVRWEDTSNDSGFIIGRDPRTEPEPAPITPVPATPVAPPIPLHSP